MGTQALGSGYATITRKASSRLRLQPNLTDYDAVCRDFRWDGARRMLDGLPGGRGLNIAHEAVDRHARGPRADHLALRWLGRAGERRDLSFRELAAATTASPMSCEASVSAWASACSSWPAACRSSTWRPWGR